MKTHPARRPIGAGAVVCLAAALASAGEPRLPLYDVFEVNGNTGAIVPADRAQEFWHAAHGPHAQIGPGWTPSREEVLKLIDDLRSHFAKQKKAKRPIPGMVLREYIGQFVGLSRDGRRFIHANFGCRSSLKELEAIEEARELDWRRVPILTLDGGDCYFQIDYDPQARTFSDLMINGVA
jgi:hypothetical protein